MSISPLYTYRWCRKINVARVLRLEARNVSFVAAMPRDASMYTLKYYPKHNNLVQ
jgi:hypothetical protein